MEGQTTYSSLWKQANEAERKDLPQTEREVLGQIVRKAEREAQYGQLLKALLKEGQTVCSVSPDSLKPFVERLSARQEQARDTALQAVYSAVLAFLYGNNLTVFDDAETMASAYRQKAVAHPAALAAVKATDYVPFVVRGKDSTFFGDDLLSVIAWETNQFEVLYQYYMSTDNRRGQLFAALEWLKAEDRRPEVQLERLDSLIASYGDLPECGEAAILRYEYWTDTRDGATPKERVAFIEDALQRWGAWKRMNVLRNARSELTRPTFSGRIEQRVSIPHQEQQVKLSGLRAINSLTMKVYRVKVDGDTQLDPNNSHDYASMKSLLTPMPELTRTRYYAGRQNYEVLEDSTVLAGLPVGVYLVEFATTPRTEVSRQLYFVSHLRVLVQPLPGSEMRYVVVDATTGQPVKGATLRLRSHSSRREDNPVVTVTTNEQGEYLYTWRNEPPREIYATTPDDRACPVLNTYGRFSYYEGNPDSEQGMVYTDRSIYRPGQTVHVAAFFYEVKNGFEHRVIKNKEVRAVMRDANYQVVDEQVLVTDDYGMVSADFTLPRAGLTGHYSIRVGSQSTSVRVEEYKRPTFVVDIPKPEQNYKAGDTLTVACTARSYAGVPVQGARVHYRVERRRAWWWMAYYRYWDVIHVAVGDLDTEVFSGETTTDADGKFDVTMPLSMPETDAPLFCNFIVTADVTDAAGETRHGELSLPLGNRKTALTVDLAEQILLESEPRATFHLRNAAGTDLREEVRYRIDGGKWMSAITQEPVAILRSSMKSGRHTLEAVCAEDTIRHDFVLFSLDDKRPATETDDWFYVSARQFDQDGKPVTLQVGSSADDVHIVYTVVSGNRVVESGAVERSNELLNRKFDYREEYGNGLALSFAWVKNGKVYEHSTTLRRPLPDKQLRMKWNTFRDRLTPGQQEEWSLTVATPDGKPAKAMLTATLYDKSLDQLAQHGWSFEPYVSLPLPSLYWASGNWGQNYFSGSLAQKYLSVEELEFSHFDHDCYPSAWRRMMRPLRRKNGRVLGAPMVMDEKMYSRAAIGSLDVEAAGEVESEQATEPVMADMAELAEENNGAETGQPEMQMRENLQETAFFYPQLLADSEGKVTVKFTLPESLTTWRFMGLAHTQDLMYGLLEGEAVARKDVMIQPNVPRFVRMGDESVVSARIFNTGEETVSATASIVLLDPETEEVVYTEQRTCLLEPNSTTPVSFAVNPMDFGLSQSSLLVCRMMVYGDSFSDGEQHYLPILPCKERVTVTVPFTQTAPGTKTVDLSALVRGEQGKLTFEYTNNPAWLMIQALPTLGHPHDDCAICQATSFYANRLGQYLLEQNPQAKHVFETWKREQGAETSLMSELEKNESLKDLVLAETPWVMDADGEAEQKQRLADFFDGNLIGLRLTSAIEKLQALQNDDGLWSWWPGMDGSFYMTVEISEMLVRLNQMTDGQEESQQLLAKSFSFMDKEIVELVKEMKKEEKKGIRQTFPSHKALQYLYIYTLDGRTPSSSVAEAQAYLKHLLKKETKNQTIYDKALSAIVLNAPLYVKSLKEYTVYREDMGRYYDSPRAAYSWRDYRIPTQVAAIEAIQRLTPTDTTTIDEMRRWLLQEKRTQAWDTPINSIDAVYAFLNGNAQALQAQPKTVLKVDGKELTTSQATAGLGYVKTAVPAQGQQSFTAEKTSTGTSWGAVYAQFMQDTKDIADQGSEIRVKREILPANGASSTSDMLKVGQRIKVRMTIEAQRDLDFVEIIDRRAACMEPVNQLSGYQNGSYVAPKDFATHYFFNMMRKGKYVIETEYYIDRPGRYETGTCTVQCAYAPEFRATTHSLTLNVEP